jgi:hypothetical protein
MLYFYKDLSLIQAMKSTSHYLPMSSTGMMTPVSLFANITVIRHVVRLTSESISCGTTQPLVDTDTILTS